MELKSYPFLALSREYGLDYGDVLSIADHVRGRRHKPWVRTEESYEAVRLSLGREDLVLEFDARVTAAVRDNPY